MPDDASKQQKGPAALPPINMNTDDLDFDLPPELIAQAPPQHRAASRLLHYRRSDQTIAHRQFAELPTLLRPGDLLVFNDTKVLPARFTLRKPTGGIVEALFLFERAPGTWRVLLKNAGHGIGLSLTFERDPTLQAQVTERYEPGEYSITLSTTEPAQTVLSRIGRMPLPPYIKRDKSHDPRDPQDLERYQTHYARNPGAVAAPTAGLHFTPEIFQALDRQGVQKTFVTLHVGLGTFKPLTVDRLEDHPMHSESYSLTHDAANALNQAKSGGRRIIPVGTTSARVLESQPDLFSPASGETNIFIYPPYGWKHTSALITNFHLPRGTLIALVAALTGLEEQRRIYSEAIHQKYRFFSYGDAMLIE
jgi:S-adenosylmethionine:tRNA ribosyltransferase-isomerase